MKNKPILNCEICGGALSFSQDGLSAKCPYCGNSFVFKDEKPQALSLALNRAAAYRKQGDYDAAINEYRAIIADYPDDAEANWGLALSIYGIEYVEDSRTGRLIPTCRRTVSQSILQNEYYLAAVKNADPVQAQVYISKAKTIDRLQRDIKRRMDEEEDFDVFLCFRSSDDNGLPTKERTVARRIYDELSSRKIRTFYSEVTLKDRLGDDYEPIIYKALYSCKFFILIATSEENINSPWVKNEWSRFRDRVQEENLAGACCAVFENISPSALPSFLHMQGVNLAKYPAGGYEIEIADNLESKFFRRDNGNTKKYKSEDLRYAIEDGEDCLSRGDFIKAAASFSRAVSLDARCGDAWLGALLADAEVRRFDGGKNFSNELCGRLWSDGATSAECEQRLASNGRIVYVLNSSNFKNAVKYSKNSLSSALEDAKRIVTEEAKRCNALLSGRKEQCLQAEQYAATPQADGTQVAQNTSDNSGLLTGAAIAGGILGAIGLSRLGRRPPRGPRGPRGRR